MPGLLVRALSEYVAVGVSTPELGPFLRGDATTADRDTAGRSSPGLYVDVGASLGCHDTSDQATAGEKACHDHRIRHHAGTRRR